jgi:hypothetical protein
MGEAGAPLLFTRKTSLPPDVSGALTTHKADVTLVRFFGDVGAVSQSVRDAVEALLR